MTEAVSLDETRGVVDVVAGSCARRAAPGWVLPFRMREVARQALLIDSFIRAFPGGGACRLVVTAVSGCGPGYRDRVICVVVRALHGDDDLSSGVVFEHVGDRVGGVAERVGPVDDHLDVTGFEECGEGI